MWSSSFLSIFQLFRFKYLLKGWQPLDIRENISDAVTTASKSIHREERAVFEEFPLSSRYHLRYIPRQLPDCLLMLIGGCWAPMCWVIRWRWSCVTAWRHHRSSRLACAPLPLHRRSRIETARTSYSWPSTCRQTTKIRRYLMNRHLEVSAPCLRCASPRPIRR